MRRLRGGRVVLGLGVVVSAFLSAPTFAVWALAFLDAEPARRKDDAAEGCMESDMSAMLLPGACLCGPFGDFHLTSSGEWRNRRTSTTYRRRSRRPLEPSTADAPDP